jgi:DNA-binding HxlR family transcriptional regulator
MINHENRLLFSSANCSVTEALTIVGEKWTLLILREAFFGLRRFEEFHRALGCARNLLSARLQLLVDHELFTRTEYREEGQRVRAEYGLTQKGREVLPVVIGLLNWGDHWLKAPNERPLHVRHRGCGGNIQVDLVCSRGHSGLSLRDMVAKPGPGALMSLPE